MVHRHRAGRGGLNAPLPTVVYSLAASSVRPTFSNEPRLRVWLNLPKCMSTPSGSDAPPPGIGVMHSNPMLSMMPSACASKPAMSSGTVGTFFEPIFGDLKRPGWNMHISLWIRWRLSRQVSTCLFERCLAASRVGSWCLKPIAATSFSAAATVATGAASAGAGAVLGGAWRLRLPAFPAPPADGGGAGPGPEAPGGAAAVLAVLPLAGVVDADRLLVPLPVSAGLIGCSAAA